MEAVGRAKDYTTICSPAPSEFLAEIALRHSDQILARTRSRLARNLADLEDFMARHAETFEWIRPRAGSVCLPRLRSGEAGEFCRRAREEAGVLLAPGPLFDASGSSFRIGFGREAFLEGLTVLEAWLR
jgi:aspartate/methionine/tyrosine aminotransferase